MTRFLLATSAIALSIIGAPGAIAAELKVRVGGYYNADLDYGYAGLPAGGGLAFGRADKGAGAEVFFLPSITLDNSLKIGADFLESFGDLNLAVSSRFGAARPRTSAGGDEAASAVWGLGLNVGYAGFSLGASFARAENGFRGAAGGTAWDIGASYDSGALSYSITYFHGESGSAGIGDDGKPTIGVGVSYRMTRGFSLKAFGGVTGTEKSGGSSDVQGFVVGTGIGLSW